MMTQGVSRVNSGFRGKGSRAREENSKQRQEMVFTTSIRAARKKG